MLNESLNIKISREIDTHTHITHTVKKSRWQLQWMGVVREEQQLLHFIVHANILNLLNLVKYFKLSTLHIIMEKVIVVTFSISKRKYKIGCRGKHTAQISPPNSVKSSSYCKCSLQF